MSCGLAEPEEPGSADGFVEDEQLQAYLRTARAPNTLEAYRSDWREFLAWCELRRLVAVAPCKPPRAPTDGADKDPLVPPPRVFGRGPAGGEQGGEQRLVPASSNGLRAAGIPVCGARRSKVGGGSAGERPEFGNGVQRLMLEADRWTGPVEWRSDDSGQRQRRPRSQRLRCGPRCPWLLDTTALSRHRPAPPRRAASTALPFVD